MSTISLRLPESLHKSVRDLAEQENISINQFIATALAEKIAALLTDEYLKERAKQGGRRRFEKALSKVKNTRPEDSDSLLTRPTRD